MGSFVVQTGLPTSGTAEGTLTLDLDIRSILFYTTELQRHMAASRGLEPLTNESKSFVLPLH